MLFFSFVWMTKIQLNGQDGNLAFEECNNRHPTYEFLNIVLKISVVRGAKSDWEDWNVRLYWKDWDDWGRLGRLQVLRRLGWLRGFGRLRWTVSIEMTEMNCKDCGDWDDWDDCEYMMTVNIEMIARVEMIVSYWRWLRWLQRLRGCEISKSDCKGWMERIILEMCWSVFESENSISIGFKVIKMTMSRSDFLGIFDFFCTTSNIAFLCLCFDNIENELYFERYFSVIPFFLSFWVSRTIPKLRMGLSN